MWSSLMCLAALVVVTAARPSDFWDDNYYGSYHGYNSRYPPVVGNRPSYGFGGSGGSGSSGGPSRSVGVCQLPIVQGPCKAAFERYASSGGVCRKFIYGGCQGNANNFTTLAECQQRCGGGGGRYGRGGF